VVDQLRFLRDKLKHLLRCLLATKSTANPFSELAFLRHTSNYWEFARKLDDLGIKHASDRIRAEAQRVAQRWFDLGVLHLEDARYAASGARDRSAYSRAYYAAYSASKAVRYLQIGYVSLKGDDHGKAPDLPDDFPEVDTWSARITTLYEHRLRADYDNWIDSPPKQSTSTAECVAWAEQFIDVTRQYVLTKHSTKW
jgi:hypothetical protein